jgi:hypothetical protein
MMTLSVTKSKRSPTKRCFTANPFLAGWLMNASSANHLVVEASFHQPTIEKPSTNQWLAVVGPAKLHDL